MIGVKVTPRRIKSQWISSQMIHLSYFYRSQPSFKLILRPDTACRVMRAAHHENLVCRIRHLSIKIFKVDPVSTVLLDQGVIYRNAAVAVGLIRKWIVDRALENDPVPRSVRRLMKRCISRHNARTEEQILPCSPPSHSASSSSLSQRPCTRPHRTWYSQRSSGRSAHGEPLKIGSAQAKSISATQRARESFVRSLRQALNLHCMGSFTVDHFIKIILHD